MSSEQQGAVQDGKRDAQGRFGAGNAGGPGNPHGKRVAMLRNAMLDEVTPEDMAAIMRKMIELAKDGSLQAAKLVLAYTLGKPESSAAPAKEEKEEITTDQLVEMMAEVLASAPAEEVTAAMETVLPESLGDVKEILRGSPSANGVLDELRERKMMDAGRGKEGHGRKK